MKILILQLARLGDILMTWPQIRALRQMHPDAQIDILVRPRFKAATQGLTELHRVIEFPMENIFEPLLGEPLHFNESLAAINQVITELREENYQWVINSTLSPASSYLTHEIASASTKVTGYTRTSDGYLSIPDDVSAYIYAQVGIDRNNRIHLSDLFTLMVGGQPSPSHWETKIASSFPTPWPQYVVVHVGASQIEKKLSPFKWRTFIGHFQKLSSLPVILIGNEAEQKDADFVALGFSQDNVLNLTGKIAVADLFPLIQKALLYIGADSAPLHIASLVGTPALNVSLSSVNFWETGPKSRGSRVLYATNEADLASEKIAREALNIIESKDPDSQSIHLVNGSPSYQAPSNTRNSDWTWSLIQAIYMEGSWPLLTSNTQKQGLKNLKDVNDLILDQLSAIKQTKNVSSLSSIIERCEEVIENVGILVPELTPLIRWYQTQKSQVPPGHPNEILTATTKVHTDFESIMLYWLSLNDKPASYETIVQSHGMTTEDQDGSSHFKPE